MQDFLNPKSMLTPGVAGSLLMFLVNGISCQFPEISPRYLALLLSFLIAAIVWFSEMRGLLQRGIYWILNSLIIFVVGFGTANLAADITGSSKAETSHVGLSSFVSVAFAQNHSAGGPTTSDHSNQDHESINTPSGPQNSESLEKELEREQTENARLKKKLESLEREEASSPQQKKEEPFFRSW